METKNVVATLENILVFSYKVTIQLPHVPIFLLSKIYPREMKTCAYTVLLGNAHSTFGHNHTK